MTIIKRTIVDRVDARGDGEISVRLKKQIVENGREIGFEYHRITLKAGESANDRLGVLNAHLTLMGNAEVSTDEWQLVRSVAQAVAEKPA